MYLRDSTLGYHYPWHLYYPFGICVIIVVIRRFVPQECANNVQTWDALAPHQEVSRLQGEAPRFLTYEFLLKTPKTLWLGNDMGISINGDTPKWMVYFMENSIKMDDN